jgi:type II secretory pathway pseudopilin PulG
MHSALRTRAVIMAQRPGEAFALPNRAAPSSAFTLPKLRGRSFLRSRRAVVRPDEGGFTLLELLVVTGIIVLLLAAVVPAVTSLSKSNGRKAAINNLLGGLEQARAQAIADGQATYVVFATFGNGTSQAILDRYNYKSYAIFEDDPANPTTPKQLTGWKTLATGVSLRSASQWLGALATSTFTFTPTGSTSTGLFPYLKFTTDGAVDPISTPSPSTTPIPFGIFEGYVNGSGDNDTNSSRFTETITVGRFTGRAEYTP